MSSDSYLVLPLQGVTGVQGATGPQGTFNTTTATAIWQPTSTYFITETLVPLITQASGGVGPTGVYYVSLPNGVADISSTVIGWNGQTGTFKSDMSTTVQVVAGVATSIGSSQSYLRNSLQASGWNSFYVYTGVSVGIGVSTPTAPFSGATGVVNWSALVQINELI